MGWPEVGTSVVPLGFFPVLESGANRLDPKPLGIIKKGVSKPFPSPPKACLNPGKGLLSHCSHQRHSEAMGMSLGTRECHRRVLMTVTPG